MDALLRHGFDTVAITLYILWDLRGQDICPGARSSLLNIGYFTGNVLANWRRSCDGSLIVGWEDYDSLTMNVYQFLDDGELNFEFIQLRNWLVDIGCPMSLVFRISRWFYRDFTFDWSFGVGSYQLAVRRFIFGRLRGYVRDRDFRDLERALFGGAFGNILQRMWAFRGFRINNVDRADCDIWFTQWARIGYDFDITTWTADDWNFEFTFDFDAVVVSVPEIRYNFDSMQECLVQYFVDHGVDTVELDRYKLVIDT